MRRWVLAGAKAQPGIEHDFDTGLPAAATTPTRADQEFGADLQWFEMAFPALRPVLRVEAGQSDAALSRFRFKPRDTSQEMAQVVAGGLGPRRLALQVKVDGRLFFVQIGIDGSRRCEAGTQNL